MSEVCFQFSVSPKIMDSNTSIWYSSASKANVMSTKVLRQNCSGKQEVMWMIMVINFEYLGMLIEMCAIRL